MIKENKKQVRKWIKEQAKKLPEETYVAFSKYFKPIQKEDEEGNKFFQIAEPELFPVNHARRLMNRYISSGLVGITDYFQRRGFELKLTDVSEVQEDI